VHLMATFGHGSEGSPGSSPAAWVAMCTAHAASDPGGWRVAIVLEPATTNRRFGCG
jgi:hypothetical protein